MATDRPPRPPGPIATVATLVGLALLVGLGVWQIQRLHWKEGLLARIHALQSAQAQPLAPALGRLAAGQDVNFTRVEAQCPDIETTAYVRLWAVPDARYGYRVITPCALSDGPYGSILVDRGFVAMDDAAKLAPGARLAGPITGVLYRGDRANLLTPPDQPAQKLWYARDIPAMAQALGAARPAPVFLMLEAPAPGGVGPTPMATPPDIPNNHLQYAITWFGLAGALLGVYLASLWRGRSR